jgi:hypothetical protein
MNTFLPHASYSESAKDLDGKRLNKQLTECWQLILCYVKVHGLVNDGVQTNFGHYSLINKPGLPQMRHHPAYHMWDGNIWSLICYTQAIGMECRERGYSASVLGNLDTLLSLINLPTGSHYPNWWLDQSGANFREDCRANLMRKDPIHYRYAEQPKEGYRWP